MKYKGRFLLFNSINNHGCGEDVMPDDCDIQFPEYVPVFWDFNRFDLVGTAHIFKDENGLNAEITIDAFSEVRFKEHDVKIGVGGYYNEIEYDASANGVLTVKKARLRHLGMTLAPANDAYYLEIAEE
jgi:hypothetical protein